MSDLSPSTLSSNLYIPPELLREIFSYCDTPTLGNVCKSNRACLELASPFLYTHVVLDSIESVVKLFLLETTSASPPSSPSITSPPSSISSLPRLVPLSRIQTFTYFSKDTSNDEVDLQLPSDLPQNLLPNPSLPIDLLVLNLRSRQRIPDERYFATVLNLFNPSSFVIRLADSADGAQFACLNFGPGYTSSPDVPFYLPSWNRLTSIVLSNSTTCLSISSLGLDQLRLAQEGEGGTKRLSFLLCHDFLDGSNSFYEWFANDACKLWSKRESMSQGSLFRLVAWVESEKEKEALESETVEEVQHDGFVFGEQPGGKLEVVVEVHPTREGKRDREDAWAGKTIESWR